MMLMIMQKVWILHVI